MPPSATLVVGSDRYVLGESEPVIVPAALVILELDDVIAPSAVRLDGRRPKIGWNTSTKHATLTADLTRETGFHELTVGPRRFLFGTEDAKLRTDGIISLLDYLGAQGLAWNGAMYFSGSDQVLRDPRLDLAWLVQVGEAIISIGTAIADRPWTSRRRSRTRLDRGVPDIGRTMRLLRQKPDLLEEQDGGPVRYTHPDGTIAAYTPREVVVRRQAKTFDTPGNRRATALLEGTSALARAVGIRAPEAVQPELFDLAERLDSLLRRPPFESLHGQAAWRPLVVGPIEEERVDSRYAAAWQLYFELYAERHWDPRRELMPEWAYGGYADAIYQRFCGQLVADHLGLRPMSEPPGEGYGPHFVGARFDLYLDITPPRSVIRDWRDDSGRRASLRPDLVLHERDTGRVALMDAKYRCSGRRATADSLTDVQLYLQAYSRQKVGVLFPPSKDAGEDIWNVHLVSDGSFSIYEIPFLPEPQMATFLREAVDPVIEELLA
jgi:hypothetical protein